MRKLNPETEKNYRAYSTFRRWFLERHPYCELFPHCFKNAYEIHHVKGHGHHGDLLCVEEFCRAACREHHRWVEDNKKEARRLGLILYR